MYVGIPYSVFMGALVSSLIHAENVSHAWNSYFHFQCCCLVGKDEDGPSGATLMLKRMIPLCCI